MIEAIIGAITGFVSSSLPYIWRYFVDKSDKKHKLEILKLQLEKSDSERKHEEYKTNVDFNLEEARETFKDSKTNIKLVDALNGTVRPVIAYGFFFLYAYCKLRYSYGSWNSTDTGIFSAILTYYYGSRGFQKIIR